MCGVRQDILSLYSEMIMGNLEEYSGIKVGGHNINNLRCADDTVLISENYKEDLQQLLDIVEGENRKKRLELNSLRTEVMVIMWHLDF